MEEDLLDELGKQEYDGKRPTFLTVLCILTFVGVGATLLFSLFTLSAMTTLENTLQQFDPQDANPITNVYRWAKISVILSLAGGLLCLTGALFMWNLRKVGYFIYILGQIVPFISTYFTFGNAGLFGRGGGMLEFQILQVVISALVPVGFIIMYGLNYKYLRK